MARNRSVAPLDEKKMNLTPYACPQGYNSHFVEKLLDMSYCARAGNCGRRVSPTCATCRPCRTLDPHFSDVTGAVVFQEVVVAIVSNDIMTKEISSDLFQNSDREVLAVPIKKLREPVIKYKYLFKCSGATLIRSVVRTSDKRIVWRTEI